MGITAWYFNPSLKKYNQLREIYDQEMKLRILSGIPHMTWLSVTLLKTIVMDRVKAKNDSLMNKARKGEEQETLSGDGKI